MLFGRSSKKDSLLKKLSSQKLDTKLVALITEARQSYSMEIKSNFIEKAVIVTIAGLLEIKGDLELRKIIIDY